RPLNSATRRSAAGTGRLDGDVARVSGAAGGRTGPAASTAGASTEFDGGLDTFSDEGGLGLVAGTCLIRPRRFQASAKTAMISRHALMSPRPGGRFADEGPRWDFTCRPFAS